MKANNTDDEMIDAFQEVLQTSLKIMPLSAFVEMLGTAPKGAMRSFITTTVVANLLSNAFDVAEVMEHIRECEADNEPSPEHLRTHRLLEKLVDAAIIAQQMEKDEQPIL